MSRPAPIIAGTLAALVLLFGAYLGAYYAALKGIFCLQEYESERLTVVKVVKIPVYRIQGDAVESFLAPAHEFDRLIRFKTWQERRFDTFDDPPSLIE